MLVVAATTLTFCPVVANPVTFPVRFPENAPENVVALNVPVDGFTLTVDTEDVAAPETVAAAGVNKTGWLADVVAATTLIFLPVVAKPVKLPEKAEAVIVPVDGVTNTVDTAEVADPVTLTSCGVNVI